MLHILLLIYIAPRHVSFLDFSQNMNYSLYFELEAADEFFYVLMIRFCEKFHKVNILGQWLGCTKQTEIFEIKVQTVNRELIQVFN